MTDRSRGNESKPATASVTGENPTYETRPSAAARSGPVPRASLEPPPSLRFDVAAIRTDAFEAGEVIAGKYIVERVLGVGGVGVVLAARHAELDEMVALKFLHPQMHARPDVVRRFAAEARAAVRIKSEYAARIFDVGVAPERGPYFVMEYLEGQNVADALEAGPFPLKHAAEMMLEACEALAVAHANGIVHRDIKPENLFLSRRNDGSAVMKVLDFGISKAALVSPDQGDALFKTQELMGTPFYMSPEQIRSTAEVDHRTDVWSLGVVFYEMITGRLPFNGDTVPGICAAVIETTPAPLASFLAAPEGIQAVVDRCLEKDPAHRFQNVAELAMALLPYGPVMGRVFAERTSTILQASGQSGGVTFRFSSAPPPSSGSLALGVPGAPLVPRFGSGAPLGTSASRSPSRPASSRRPELAEADAMPAARERTGRSALVLAAIAIVVGIAGGAYAFAIGRRPTIIVQSAPPSAAATNAPATAEPPAMITEEVTVSLVARPVEARIYLDDVQVPTNPYKRLVPRDGKPHAVRAEAYGYATRSIALAFDSNKEVVLALDRSAMPARPARVEARPAPSGSAIGAGAAAVAATPTTPTTTASAPKNLQEVDLPKTKKPVRSVDTASPW